MDKALESGSNNEHFNEKLTSLDSMCSCNSNCIKCYHCDKYKQYF